MCKLTHSEEAKKKRGICITHFCTHKAAKGRNRCYACARADWAARNPEKYLFANLRGNARRRGKEFGLTFEEFKEFLVSENYLKQKRGRTKTSVSIDRKRNELGYVKDNLQALTVQGNSWKRTYVDYFRQHEQASA